MNKAYNPLEWLTTAKGLKRGPTCSICVNEPASEAIRETITIIDEKHLSIPIASLVPMVEEHFDLIVTASIMCNHVREHVRKAKVRKARTEAAVRSKLEAVKLAKKKKK